MKLIGFVFMLMTSSLVYADVFLDEFSSSSYSNQDGDQLWSGDWIETGDDGSPSFFAPGSNISVFIGSLIMSGGDNFIERRLNLAGYTQATLEFDYQELGFDTNGDRIDIYVTSGMTWVLVGRLRGADLNSGRFSVDISAYISNNTGIQLRTSDGLGDNDLFLIDYIRVDASPNRSNQHISISHDGSAVSCVAETITFSIHDNLDQLIPTYTGQITVSARQVATGLTGGSWALASAANPASFIDNGDGTFSYTLTAADNGRFIMQYVFKQEGVINFDTVSGSLTEFPTEDPDLTFAATFLSEGNFRDEFSEVGSNYRDRFDSVSYSNNDGALSWTSNWIETDRIAGGSPSTGDVRITSGRLELTGNNTTFPNLVQSAAEREADLSSATTATLRFTMRSTSVEANDVASVSVSSNGGASWVVLATYSDDISNFQPFSFDISPYISSNTRIRFRIEDQSGSTCCFGPADEILQIEDIQIITNPSGSFNNNDGSLSFSSPWVESDGTGPGNGPVSIYYDALYLYGTNTEVTSLARAMDLSPYDDALLTFDYRAIGNIDTDDQVQVQVNDGSGWTLLQTITGNVSGSSSLNLQAYLSSNTQIRFLIDDPGIGGNCCYDNNQEVFRIDNVNVEVFQISTCKGADHFSIIHSGSGVNCEAEQVTIVAKDAAGNQISDYDGEITLSTSSAHGDWGLNSGSGIFNGVGVDAGSATYEFSALDNGAVVFNYLNTHVETISINVEDNLGVTETSNNATALDDPALIFARSGFKFIYGTGTPPVSEDIPVHTSGRPLNQSLSYEPLKLRAITTDLDTGVCTGLFTGPQTIDLALQCNTPANCSASNASQFSISGTNLAKNTSAGVSNYTAVMLNFSSNSTADLSNSIYSDAGAVALHARLIQAGDNILGSSQPMEFTPAGFCTTTSEPNFTCTGPDYWNCSRFKQAGEDFNLRVTAQGWRNDGDGDFCDNNFVLPNFNHSVSLTNNLISPVAGEPGSLSLNTVPLLSGQFDGVMNWSEVGVMNIEAGGNNYLSHVLVTSPSHEFGRFYPADFFISNLSPGSFANANTGFSYVGELDAAGLGGIEYSSPPQFDFVARNLQGSTVKNYVLGSFNKNPLPVINTTTAILGADGLTDLSVTAGFNNPTTNYDSATGVFRVSLSADDHYRYDHELNAMVAPFINDIQININDYVDDDGVSLSNNLAINPVGQEIRFGRLVLSNAYGPETQSLTHQWQTQYFDGNQFVNNLDDSGTLYDLSGIGTITVTDIGSASDPFLSTDSSATGASGDTGNFMGGVINVIWSAPIGGRYGQFRFPYASPNWLQYDWSGTGFEDPQAEITFGQYRGHDKVIYWKEVYYK